MNRDQINLKALRENYFQTIVKERINGKISKKYIDRQNHGLKTIEILQEFDTISRSFNFDYSGFFGFVEINDSIFKESHSNLLILKRGEKTDTFFIDYEHPPRKIICKHKLDSLCI